MEWPVLQCSLFPCHGSNTLEERDLRIFLSFPVFPHSQVPLHWDPYNKVARRRQAWSWAIFPVTLGSTANTHVCLFRGRDTLNSCSNQRDLNCPDGNCVLYQKCSFFFLSQNPKGKQKLPRSPPHNTNMFALPLSSSAFGTVEEREGAGAEGFFQ